MIASVYQSPNQEEEERDQEREDAKRLGDSEAENQVAELALRSGRIAHSGRQIVAENDAHADAGAAHPDAGDTGYIVLS